MDKWFIRYKPNETYKLDDSNGVTEITFKASCKPNTYTVAFSENGEDKVNGDSVKATFDSEYGTLPTAEKLGYEFTGWYTESKDGKKIESKTIYKTAGNQKLYAHYKPNTYKLEYELNGGKNTSDIKTATFDTPFTKEATVNHIEEEIKEEVKEENKNGKTLTIIIAVVGSLIVILGVIFIMKMNKPSTLPSKTEKPIPAPPVKTEPEKKEEVD